MPGVRTMSAFVDLDMHGHSQQRNLALVKWRTMTVRLLILDENDA